MDRVLVPGFILRISLAIVFFYFGFMQVYSPSDWTAFIPSVFEALPFSLTNFVLMNGVLELTLGAFLLIGLYTRLSALVLSLHLFGIAVSIGFNPLGVRDFGLAAATFALFLHQHHALSVDSWSQKSTAKTSKNLNNVAKLG